MRHPAWVVIGFLIGYLVGASLNLWGGYRDQVTYEELKAAKDSLAIDVETCQYHVNRATGNLSSLESDIAEWLRGHQ